MACTEGRSDGSRGWSGLGWNFAIPRAGGDLREGGYETLDIIPRRQGRAGFLHEPGRRMWLIRTPPAYGHIEPRFAPETRGVRAPEPTVAPASRQYCPARGLLGRGV